MVKFRFKQFCSETSEQNTCLGSNLNMSMHKTPCVCTALNDDHSEGQYRVTGMVKVCKGKDRNLNPSFGI